MIGERRERRERISHTARHLQSTVNSFLKSRKYFLSPHSSTFEQSTKLSIFSTETKDAMCNI